MSRFVITLVCWALLSECRVAAAEGPLRVEIFTLTNVPIANAMGAEIHVVDALHTLTQALSRDLPKVPDQAKEVVLTRMQSGESDFTQRTHRAVRALTRAAQLHIDRIPAVVFDDTWVVYGVPDVMAARSHLRHVDIASTRTRKP